MLFAPLQRTLRPTYLALLLILTPMAHGLDGHAAGDADPHAHNGLPFLDSRFAGTAASPRVQAAIDSTAQLTAPARAAAIERLTGLVNGLRIDIDPLLGTPALISSPFAFLTPGDSAQDPAALSTRAVISDFITANQALFDFAPALLDTCAVAREYTTAHNGLRHMHLQQQLSGLDLFGCELRATVTPRAALVNISSLLIPPPKAPLPERKLSDFEALLAALVAVEITPSELPVPIASPHENPDQQAGIQHWSSPDLRPPSATDTSTTTRPIFFPLTREEIHPAFLVTVAVPGAGHTYDLVIDALDGAVLRRSDRLVWDTTQPATFRVYTSDSPSPFSPGTSFPSAFQPPTVARELLTINPLDIAPFSPNGWIPDGSSTTVGNNVDAHADANGDNVADLPRPSGGPFRQFDFPIDLAQPPSSYRIASIAQAFYTANWYHDRLYALGFDEAAGNFQTSNFGRGGLGNDALQLDCQDGSGTNNANFNGDAADGAPARVQMYVWTGANPDRDGSLDADLLIHELTHGLSKRLARMNDLNGQPPALGEGWSDFFALALNSRPGDDPNANYPFSAYVASLWQIPTFTSNYYFGIRRYPYSSNFTTSPLTLADIDPNTINLPPGVPVSPAYGQPASDPGEAHNAGEVWCAALWQARAQMHARLGPPANDTLLQLVVDGMKLSPSSPTFVNARDGVLQADLINHYGANADALWNGFALRGLGSGASVPPANSTFGVVENFDTPHTIIWSYPSGLPQLRAAGEPTLLRFTVAPLGLSVMPGSVTVHYAFDDGPFTDVPAEPDGPPTSATPPAYRATLPPTTCGHVLRYYVSAATSIGTLVDPPAAPALARRIATGENAPAMSDAFEQPSGWTVGPDTAGEGRWIRADPVGYTVSGRQVQPADDHTPDGTMCFATGQSFFQQLTYGRTILNSPAIDLSSSPDAQITYWRWYVNGAGSSPNRNVLTAQASVDDGVTWHTTEVVGPGSASDPNVNPGWRFASWRLSTFGLAPSATTRVRFIAENAFGSGYVMALIDDFSITTVTCAPPPCPPDFNTDGALNPDDLADYIAAYFTQPPPPAADYNADGTTDPDDLADYIAAYFAGC